METMMILQAMFEKIITIIGSLEVAGFNILEIIISLITINIITMFVFGGAE